jgi:predicted CopG family antitoxin
MRTTLTIDDDVAAALERLRKSEDKSLKDVVNQTLRRGLEQPNAAPKKRKQSYTRPVSLGPSLIGSLDDISEVIAIAEGEDHK